MTFFLCKFQVDEVGTVAAAATAAVVAVPTSLLIENNPPPPFVFNADHSFLFGIRHEPTKTWLFIGSFIEP